jgi:hypothetical protein
MVEVPGWACSFDGEHVSTVSVSVSGGSAKGCTVLDLLLRVGPVLDSAQTQRVDVWLSHKAWRTIMVSPFTVGEILHLVVLVLHKGLLKFEVFQWSTCFRYLHGVVTYKGIEICYSNNVLYVQPDCIRVI